MARTARISHVIFAITMIALGIVGRVKADYVSLWQPLPRGIPALGSLCALVSLATGLGLLWRRTATFAARFLFFYLVAWLLLVRVPGIFLAPNVEYWWAAGKIAVMLAAAWVLYIHFATERDHARIPFVTGSIGLRIATAFYGAAMIVFGVAHFLYLKETAGLVPAWLPWHVALASFTGGAFIVAGVAMILGVLARLAAALSAMQMGLFTLLVWVPVVAAGTKNAFQWSETILSAALTVAGWVVADSYRSLRNE